MAREKVEAGPEGKRDINTVTFEELAEIEFIREQRAKRIIKYREEHGGYFDDMDELKDVPFINNRVLEVLKENFVAIPPNSEENHKPAGRGAGRKAAEAKE